MFSILLPPSPELYLLMLTLWTYFPLVSLYQLFISDFYPMGKTTLPKTSKWAIFNLPGRLAWITMELPSPIWLVVTAILVSRVTGVDLFSGSGDKELGVSEWPEWVDRKKREVLVLVYLVHYVNRAIINPLLTPTSTPMHLLVYLLAHIFNLFNPILIGASLGGYSIPPKYATHPPQSTATSSSSTSTDPPLFEFEQLHKPKWGALTSTPPQFLLGMTIWLLGFLGNLYHERILRGIRSEKKELGGQVAPKEEEEKEKSEDAGDTTTTTTTTPSTTSTTTTHPTYAEVLRKETNHTQSHQNPEEKQTSQPLESATPASLIEPNVKFVDGRKYVIPQGGLFEYILFPHYFCEWVEWTGFAIAAGWGCTPAILFVINEISTMLPRAISGKRWYQRTFGAQLPADKKAAIPFLI